MSQAKKMCFDRILPSHLRKPHRTMAYAGGRLRAIAPIGKQWPNGSNIRTRFLEGTQQQQDMVRSIVTSGRITPIPRSSSRTTRPLKSG